MLKSVLGESPQILLPDDAELKERAGRGGFTARCERFRGVPLQEVRSLRLGMPRSRHNANLTALHRREAIPRPTEGARDESLSDSELHPANQPEWGSEPPLGEGCSMGSFRSVANPPTTVRG